RRRLPRLELDHEVDVALRGHFPARGRAEEAQLPDTVLSAQRGDLLPGNVEPGPPCADGVLSLGLLQHWLRASAHQDLGDDAAQLLEGRRAAIGLVMLLIAEPADRHQTRRGEAPELALD